MYIKENPILKGILEIVLEPLSDERGFLMRTFDEELFRQANIPTTWVQENHSINIYKNTVRGLHFILPPYTDGKLIRCIKGGLFDVFVDLRKGSPTFGKWESVVLSENDYKWIYLPKGLAHGFCTLADHTELIYKHDIEYNNGYDCGIIWNDSDLMIDWPCIDPVISVKDKDLMTFKEFVTTYGGL